MQRGNVLLAIITLGPPAGWGPAGPSTIRPAHTGPPPRKNESIVAEV